MRTSRGIAARRAEARARFEVRARLDDDVVANERDAQSLADALHVVGVARAGGARVVIDVVDGHDEPGVEGEQEQSQGVRATGDRQIGVGPGVGEVTPRQQSGGHFQEVRQRGEGDDWSARRP